MPSSPRHGGERLPPPFADRVKCEQKADALNAVWKVIYDERHPQNVGKLQMAFESTVSNATRHANVTERWKICTCAAFDVPKGAHKVGLFPSFYQVDKMGGSRPAVRGVKAERVVTEHVNISRSGMPRV